MAKVIESLVIELRSTFDKLGSDMNSAARTLSGFEQKFKTIGKTIGAAFGIGLGTVAATSIKNAVQGILNLANTGDRLDDLRSSFEKLGGDSGAIKAAQDKTLGMVSAFDLMRVANRGLLAGLPMSNQEFALMADVATRVADATGRDAKEAIDSLMGAIIKGSPKALKEFGVLVEKGASYATILQKLKEVQASTSPVTDSVANAQAAVNVAWTDAIGQLGIYINDNETLRIALRDLQTTITEVDLKLLADGLAAAATQAVNLANSLISVWTNLDGVVEQAKLQFAIQERMKKLIRDGVKAEDARIQAISEYRNEIEATNDKVNQSNLLTNENTKGTKLNTDEKNKQTKALEKLSGGWDKLVSSLRDDLLKDAIKGAIEQGDESVFLALMGKFGDATYEGTRAGLQKFVGEVPGVTNEVADHMAEIMTGRVVEPFWQQWSSRASQSTQSWGAETAQAFEGFFTSFQSLLGQVETTFGVKIPEGMKKTLSVIEAVIDAVKTINQLIEGINKIISFIETGTSGSGNPVEDIINGISSGIDTVTDFLGFAKGGVVDSPTFFSAMGQPGVMGEAGPEAILPLTRKGGVLGVANFGAGGSGAQIFIDARGAAPGVEFAIERAIGQMRSELLDEAVSAVYSAQRSSSGFRENF